MVDTPEQKGARVSREGAGRELRGRQGRVKQQLTSQKERRKNIKLREII